MSLVCKVIRLPTEEGYEVDTLCLHVHMKPILCSNVALIPPSFLTNEESIDSSQYIFIHVIYPITTGWL